MQLPYNNKIKEQTVVMQWLATQRMCVTVKVGHCCACTPMCC